jgi:hypothetical protein
MKNLVIFQDERDWKQCHEVKNLAITLSIEATELNELFLLERCNGIRTGGDSPQQRRIGRRFDIRIIASEKYRV